MYLWLNLKLIISTTPNRSIEFLANTYGHINCTNSKKVLLIMENIRAVWRMFSCGFSQIFGSGTDYTALQEAMAFEARPATRNDGVEFHLLMPANAFSEDEYMYLSIELLILKLTASVCSPNFIIRALWEYPSQ